MKTPKLTERQKSCCYRVSATAPEVVADILLHGIPLVGYEDGVFFFPLSECSTGSKWQRDRWT